ncbi:MAG TPA: DMT family transporter [Dehalococcoidia bacterium]|nr:DMT family transporter [Dehalococcoidia bacterium]
MPPQLVLALGVVAVSSAAVIIRLAGEAPALVIGAYRLGIASLVVVPAVSFIAPRDLRAYPRHLIPQVLASGVLLALHFAFWIASLDYTSVAASVVLVTTAPLMVAPLSYWLTGDRVTRQTLGGILIGLIGIGLIAFGNALSEAGSLVGDGLALLGAAAMAGHQLAGRRLRRRLSLPAYIAVIYPVAAVALWGAAGISGGPLIGFSAATYGYLLLLGLLPQVLGHSMLNWSLGHLSAVAVSTAVMAEPVGATVLAFLVLGEAPGMNEVLGGAVVLGGVYLALRGEGRRRPSGPADAILAT